ncbi:DUF86 domain-containing protein [Desmospora activa]|uniref:Uncharacterized protein YutE (UPF0331/DUF86 family) n=1 Tax=Desmospora activa DSM 45169 TaxID=1121389 RepID=A0A2T4Z748_9BACL|nr:DUF86 domain-containing protein [Desmospora activa]PTM57685.1 uncharacterized protein YutE (UPF0331/DUF86 family) [Desmospora activa DSM 45169]
MLLLYEVDTARIQAQLAYLERCCQVMDQVQDLPNETAFFAASRAVHIAMECVIDVGSVMIDGFIMRDPGGYEDIIDIMEDERVIPAAGARQLKEWVSLRDRCLRHYTEVSPDELRAVMAEKELFRSFIRWVQQYLERELGRNH